MIKLKGHYLSILKTLHLLFVAAYFGGLMASLVILGSGAGSETGFGRAAAHMAIYRINAFVVYYSFLGLTVTALVYGLFTNWGILKHRWIILKWLLLFAIAGIYILAYKPSVNGIAALSSGGQDTGVTLGLFEELLRKSLVFNVLIVFLLFIVFLISTLRPFGRRNSDFLADNKVARISLLSLIVLSTGFFILGWINLNRLRNIPIGNPDLTTINDGIYKGAFSDGARVYTVEVELADHRIQNLVLESDRYSIYVDYARPVINRIIEEQTLDLDGITGATTTSRCILKAVEEALIGERSEQ